MDLPKPSNDPHTTQRIIPLTPREPKMADSYIETKRRSDIDYFSDLEHQPFIRLQMGIGEETYLG